MLSVNEVEKIQNDLSKKEEEKLRASIGNENILKEWGNQGIFSIEEAEAALIKQREEFKNETASLEQLSSEIEGLMAGNNG